MKSPVITKTLVVSEKTKEVSDILNENHIIVLPEERTIPKRDEELSDNRTIKITKNVEDEIIAEKEAEVTSEEILKSYHII